jgi:hypothetical protein
MLDMLPKASESVTQISLSSALANTFEAAESELDTFGDAYVTLEHILL